MLRNGSPRPAQRLAYTIIGVHLALPVFVISTPDTASAVDKADRVVVSKHDKTLSLYKGDRILASFHVVFGANPVGHKQEEGDQRTPEGVYVLDYKKADSAYYKAIHISYPNGDDAARAKKRGVSPGGAIMVHGQKNGWGWAAPLMQRHNWTDGCIALSNDDMDQVWKSVDAGTPIEIRP
jgi:murein L,D-transpeptidase YafK